MFRISTRAVATTTLCVFLGATVLGQTGTAPRKRGPTFPADYAFSGSALTDWKMLGQATWRAQSGDIIGTPTSPAGGWIVLDKSYQDVKLYANVLCTGGCKAGVMLRAEPTADGGLKGLFMSLTEGDVGPYNVTIDAQGNEVRREKFAAPAGRGGGGGGRGAAAPGGAARGGAPAGGPGGAAPAPGGGRGAGAPNPADYPPGTLFVAGSPLPPLSPELVARFPEMASRPVGVLHPGQSNEVELLLTANTMSPKFNGAVVGGGMSANVSGTAEADGFGRVALYVGGTNAVHFSDLRTQDLLKRQVPTAQVSKNFRVQQLNDIYYSWTPEVADYNRDGIQDVAAGPFIYFGPDFSAVQQVATAAAANPIGSYPESMIGLSDDFTGDGWPDRLLIFGNTAGGSATGKLYVNPKGESRYWKQYDVLTPIGNEDTLLADIDGDGKREVIHCGENMLRYSKPDPANPTGTWITRTVSAPGMWGAGVSHGLGVGDINGDGRMDYLSSWGWWEQPANNTAGTLWVHHPEGFGRFGASQGGPLGGSGGADLSVYDVNGDGLNDVVATLEGHGFGMAWFEQRRDATRTITFVRHMIMDNFLTKNAGNVTFTQPHAGVAADIDGDGIPDYVTGKRFMSHFGYADPDSYSPAVVYVYKTVRNPKAPGGAEFVPELISNRAGVGSRVVVADLNNDGSNDVVTSANFGTFVFFNNVKPRVRATPTPR